MPKTTAPTSSGLEHLPISFFAVVMGLAGLTIATHKISAFMHWEASYSHYLAYLTACVWGVVALAYALKAFKHRDAVLAEWRHPVRLSFFPAATIGLILLSIAFSPIQKDLAQAFWWIGSIGHLLMTLTVMRCWIQQEYFEINHSNPAWFIPVVGNILVPIAGVQFAPVDVSWFCFSIGIVFWFVLLTIIFNRLIFHAPLPGKLVPTLAILLAPPSVGFLAWYKLSGQIDAFAHILYGVAMFFFLLLLTQIPRFSRLQFALSWWAYTFPLAAFTVATLVMAENSDLVGYLWLGQALYAALVVLIIGVAGRTIQAMIQKEICVPEN